MTALEEEMKEELIIRLRNERDKAEKELTYAREIIKGLYIAIRDGDEGVLRDCTDTFYKAEKFLGVEK